MQGSGHFAGALPIVEVGYNLALGEPPREVAQKLAFGCRERVAHGSTSMGTRMVRPRRTSPSALACGSKRVDAATPRPSRPRMTKLIAFRFGNSYRSMSKSLVSG